MTSSYVQDVFINLGGQDDNLGDSVLRAAYYDAAQGASRRFHVLLEGKSSDYVAGLHLDAADVIYTSRAAWSKASSEAPRAVQLIEAGESNPRAKLFPDRARTAQLRQTVDSGGLLILAGTGLKDPSANSPVNFDPVLREAAVVSWRDVPSRDAAGFGDVAPDWAFAYGGATDDWTPLGSRPLLAVTLRFDRPWPGDAWLHAVRSIAVQTSTRVVTVAQVARDAPRAVRLAEELGGEYLMPPTMKHDDLDAHVRAAYAQSLAVISDRAHGLIIGATEGAYPVGSAADPQKIRRLLDAAGLGALVGRYDEMSQHGDQLESRFPMLAPAVDAARVDVANLGARIREAMSAHADRDDAGA